MGSCRTITGNVKAAGFLIDFKDKSWHVPRDSKAVIEEVPAPVSN
jgi:hypothetical protein